MTNYQILAAPETKTENFYFDITLTYFLLDYDIKEYLLTIFNQALIVRGEYEIHTFIYFPTFSISTNLS